MTLRKILIMVENDVAGEMVFYDHFSFYKKLYDDALTNELKIIKVDNDVLVERGDIWNGTSFDKPDNV